MLKIGLTGGIGSGKSTVAKVFEVLGIPVYYADEVAKRLMNEDESLREKIKKKFGTAVYSNGLLNKKQLAQIVFTSPEKLALLNSLVHPLTLEDAERWMNEQSANYCIKEAALIFESAAHEQIDYVIGISAPTALRIQRTMQRDGITKEAVIARMNTQLDETIKMKLCNFVIVNDEQNLILPQVLALHNQLITLSKNN